MRTFTQTLPITLLLAAALALAPESRAAESYDNCTGFIEGIPAVIGTQGVWCLRHDMSTALTSGNAIDIQTNNVTIDCNGFKLGGLAAGDSSTAAGISAYSRTNITIRNCNIRGFHQGIRLGGASGGGNHLVEDNRLDNNLHTGIYVDNVGGVIRRNQINDTGGAPGASSSYGIYSYVDVVDNTITGGFSTGTNSNAVGILIGAQRGLLVRGNRVRDLAQTGTGIAIGISVGGFGGDRVEGNHIYSSTDINGYGIRANTGTFCLGNTVTNYSTAISLCDLVGDTNASN